MTVGADGASREALVWRGITFEIVTLSWMAIEAAAAVAAGFPLGALRCSRSASTP
jgi:hypothetical protein